MPSTERLNALRFRLHNEKERLTLAATPVEFEYRAELVRIIEHEIIAEIYLLKTKGIMVAESANIDTLYNNH